MAYQNMSDDAIAVDAQVNTTLMTNLRSNQIATRESLFMVNFASSANSTSGAYNTQASFDLRLISETQETNVTRNVSLILLANVTTGTGQVRLTDNGSGSSGTAVDVTNTIADDVTIDVDVQSGWVGSTRQFDVESQAPSGGTITVSCIDRVTGLVIW